MSHRDEATPPPVPAGEEKTETEPMSASTGVAPVEQAPREPLPARPPPRQVGRFLLLKQLGQGGMGMVYAAYDPDLDRKVALKLLLVKNEGTNLEEGRERLVREAQAMARVSHPHVIPVFEVGSWDDQVFVAMELVEGGTLREWLRERPRSWREVLEKYVAAGKGLAAAHAAGLVHRDFKPANVLVGHNGRVYVTDFGLARRDARFTPSRGLTQEELPLPRPVSVLRRSLTQVGVVHGTPHYMSPEQFRGDALDARSDQFSFCAALYRALFNTRPFEPEEMSRAAAQRGASPSIIQEPPRGVKVPVWVRRAVMRGLSLEPGARFASMDVLLEALSQERRLVRRRWLGVGPWRDWRSRRWEARPSGAHGCARAPSGRWWRCGERRSVNGWRPPSRRPEAPRRGRCSAGRRRCSMRTPRRGPGRAPRPARPRACAMSARSSCCPSRWCAWSCGARACARS